MAVKFSNPEIALIKEYLPEHWFAEEDHLVHPIGDRLERDASGGFTLYQQNSFPTLGAALVWLKENG